jgi:hypothetical protein
VCNGMVARVFLRWIRFLFRRLRLYFLNGTGDAVEADGPAAKYIHVLCCLNAASLRRFPWVSGVPLRKCKPLADGAET